MITGEERHKGSAGKSGHLRLNRTKTRSAKHMMRSRREKESVAAGTLLFQITWQGFHSGVWDTSYGLGLKRNMASEMKEAS